MSRCNRIKLDTLREQLKSLVVVGSVICCKEGNLTSTYLVILQDVEQIVCNIRTSMAPKGVAHCKDNIMKLIVIPKVVHNDSKKVKDVVICLLSIEGDSNFALCASD